MNAMISKREKFKNWRARRPFWGATLSILAGIVILSIPVQLYEIAAVPGSMVVVGLLLGGLPLLMGILALIFPKLSTLLGTITIFSAVLSILGALGGFLVGTLLGIVGGAMQIAWKPVIASADSGEHPEQKPEAEKEVASGKELSLE